VNRLANEETTATWSAIDLFGRSSLDRLHDYSKPASQPQSATVSTPEWWPALGGRSRNVFSFIGGMQQSAGLLPDWSTIHGQQSIQIHD